MQYVVPDYYEAFCCTQSDCKHNCCIGWGIDIDSETKQFYDTVGGAFGDRLRDNISLDGEPHFRLDKRERCPFLNENNLCDIILQLGEDRLCDICAMHPRFCNELPGRTEIGLGLCCEAAARLILGHREPIMLIVTGDTEQQDDIVALRDAVIATLQQRELSLPCRVKSMLEQCSVTLPHRDLVPLLLSLERLDEDWTKRLLSLQSTVPNIDGFSEYMKERETEYEQLLVYLIYRHFANAPTLQQVAARAMFAAYVFDLLFHMGAVQWENCGSFTFEDQVELARLFSSEIEYSDENLYVLLEELA